VILPDVNVLVYAFRRDSERHAEYRRWLSDIINGDSAFGLSEEVLVSVVRIATHPRIYREPSSPREALSFIRGLSDHPQARMIRSGDRRLGLFTQLCESSAAKANLVTDAWHAALAVESGCTWITADRDFARFPGLKWKHPLDHDHAIENPA